MKDICRDATPPSQEQLPAYRYPSVPISARALPFANILAESIVSDTNNVGAANRASQLVLKKVKGRLVGGKEVGRGSIAGSGALPKMSFPR